MGGAEAGRDMGLTSRPGLLLLGSRPGLFSWCRDMDTVQVTLSSNIHRGRRLDGGRPLVYAD